MCRDGYGCRLVSKKTVGSRSLVDIYNQTKNKAQIREQSRLLAEERRRNDKTPQKGMDRFLFEQRQR